jgi:formamidopyrimidine-DNA glycosylase
MPELPDVETFRRYLDETSLHKRIVATDVSASRILGNVTVRALGRELKGRTLDSSRRHGKHLLAALDDGRWLAFHFGMTGSFKYFKNSGADPEHDRLRLSFANGYHLAYVCQRLLGEVDLVKDADKFVRRKGLGPDALRVDFELFRELMTGRRGMVKSTLMDQKLLAGIGNVYSDEILFQAGLHPRTPVASLDEDELRRLYDVMARVLQTAVAARADAEKMPDDYLITHRGPGGECPLCGEPLRKIKVSGRTAYFCPRHQAERRAGDRTGPASSL